MVEIELLYAPVNDEMVHLHLTVSEGETVENVIAQSGILERYPEVSHFAVGIYSKQVEKTAIVQAGDRIEIYRPLLIDPMEKRRQRAKKKA